MNQNTTTPPHLFVLRCAQGMPEPTPEQMQKTMEGWMAWIDEMKAKGQYLGGDRLEDSPAATLRGPLGRSVSDGPFAEAKEVVGGYMLIAARDFSHAREIAMGCPGLDNGWSVEVRKAYPPQP